MNAPTRSAKAILPPAVEGEPDEERRLRDAINRMGGQMLSALDSAVALRTAPAEAQRERHNARARLEEFGLHALNSLRWARAAQADS